MQVLLNPFFAPSENPKGRIKFSASRWSGNKKYSCFLFIASRTLLQKTSIDFYKKIFLHVIPARIAEIHITCKNWKDDSDLYSISGFTFISKCRQTGEGESVGIYIAEKLKWKRREGLKDVKIEGIWIEDFQTKANSFIIGAV